MTTAVTVINNAIEAASRDLAAAKVARIRAEGALLDAQGAEEAAEAFLADLRAAANVLTPEDDGPVIEPPVTPTPEPEPEPEPTPEPTPEPEPEPTPEEGEETPEEAENA